MFTSIDRVDLHDIFGKINTNTGNCVHDFPLPQMCNGYHDGTRRRRRHRDGSSLPIPAARAEIPELANVKHVFVKASARVNNRAENSHQPTRERERRMRGFRDAERTQTFLSSFGPIRQHFALKRHLMRASLYRKQLGERFAAWQRFTELAQAPSGF
ncbi:hypothetical protein R69749_07595 [Paraburkholderia domus]|uniref:DDE domain-containing protein n=1 Tax=Paraburkholderia nemoris TaxID=2793076 RepID=A0ABM8T5K1_9BURK|nr:hypothetical protein R75777_07868 [Paraburkholderia nemoris]CAE6858203.1 hypothetical protein R69776_07860 [Paraburkholderia nemoris]CAE6890744.1 hypothetical protein R69749_07595 [Paraburkholderia domus]